MTNAVEVTQLKKNYGSVQALRGIDLQIPQGSLYGIIGPNGAGKTTLFSLLLGYLQPTAGTVRVLGVAPTQLHTLQGKVSALPQDADLPATVSVDDALNFFARVNGQTDLDAEMKRVLEVVDLSGHRSTKLRALSHGMRKRVYVAMALLGRPDLVVLDEPTAGLDPKHAYVLGQALKQLVDQKTTLVISSHNLDELESLCTHAAVLVQGNVVKAGTLDEVRSADEQLHVSLAPGAFDTDALTKKLEGVTVTYDAAQHRVTLSYKPTPQRTADDLSSEAIAAIVALGGKVRTVERGHSLLQTYLELEKKG